MEQVCLIAFSSESYVVAPFTRDYSALRSALYVKARILQKYSYITSQL